MIDWIFADYTFNAISPIIILLNKGRLDVNDWIFANVTFNVISVTILQSKKSNLRNQFKTYVICDSKMNAETKRKFHLDVHLANQKRLTIQTLPRLIFFKQQIKSTHPNTTPPYLIDDNGLPFYILLDIRLF